MAAPVEVAQGIYRLEGEVASSFQLPAVYFVRGEYVAVVETGPASMAPYILQALGQLGWARDEVRYLIPTHIHLDHGGGAGRLVRELPQAQVVVYCGAARHLLDPSKLIEGTRHAFGPDFEEELGPIIAVPEERLVAVGDGAMISLGGRELEICYTPGHANHHISILDLETRAVFCGEALGHYLPGIEVVRPTVAPPIFEVDVALESIDKLRSLEPKLLLFAQYGVSSDTERIFQLAREAVEEYSGAVLEALRQGLSEEEIGQRLAALESTAEERRGGQPIPEGWLYEHWQIAAGLSAYFRRRNLV